MIWRFSIGWLQVYRNVLGHIHGGGADCPAHCYQYRRSYPRPCHTRPAKCSPWTGIATRSWAGALSRAWVHTGTTAAPAALAVTAGPETACRRRNAR